MSGTRNASIEIHRQLEVLPNNKILIPGCEPTSALTSTRLASWLAEQGCQDALVDVDVALENIPGSYLKFGSNFNKAQLRQKWFVLPAVYPECPCSSYPDYYQILRDLASEEIPPEEDWDACNMNGSGYCPSPDFQEPPPEDPYRQEGSWPPGMGVLPPIPPWKTS